MSMYSGIIKGQAEIIAKHEETMAQYAALAQELMDVLCQYLDISEYERRLAAIQKGNKDAD